MSGPRRHLISLTASATVTLLAAGLVGTAPASAAVPASLMCAGSIAPQTSGPVPSAPPVAVADGARAVAGLGVTIDPLANDTDPDGDELFIAGLGMPRRGYACINGDGTIQYFALLLRRNLTETLTYGITDGDRYRSGTITVRVEGVKPVRADVRQRLVLGKQGRVVRRARLAFTNPTSVRMYLGGGAEQSRRPGFERMIGPGKTVVVRTSLPRLTFYTVLAPRDDDQFALVNFGRLNTRTTRQQIVYAGGEDVSFLREAAGTPADLWGSRIR